MTEPTEPACTPDPQPTAPTVEDANTGERADAGERPTAVKRTLSTLAAAAVTAALLTGCTAHRVLVGKPVSAAAPTQPAAAEVGSTGSCSYPGEFSADDQVGSGLVVVGSSPNAVVIEWLPGLDQHPCAAVLSRAGTRTARELARAVDTAPVYPSGSSSCPGADDMTIHLFFQFSGHGAEQADVGISGCEEVAGPERSPRQLTQRMADDLRPLAPQPWRFRLHEA